MGELYKYLVGGGEGVDPRWRQPLVRKDFPKGRKGTEAFNCLARASCPPKSGIINPTWGGVAEIDPACLVSRHGMGGEVSMGQPSETFKIVFTVVQTRLGKDSDLVRQLEFYRLYRRLPEVGEID